jgi:hypothetical protein
MEIYPDFQIFQDLEVEILYQKLLPSVQNLGDENWLFKKENCYSCKQLSRNSFHQLPSENLNFLFY